MSDDDALEPLITQCPNCDTRFRVSETQLQMAAGRVRCGACLTVFDGAEHLLLDADPLHDDESDDVDALLAELEDLDQTLQEAQPPEFQGPSHVRLVPSPDDDDDYLDEQVSRGLAELEAQLLADLREEGANLSGPRPPAKVATQTETQAEATVETAPGASPAADSMDTADDETGTQVLPTAELDVAGASGPRPEDASPEAIAAPQHAQAQPATVESKPVPEPAPTSAVVLPQLDHAVVDPVEDRSGQAAPRRSVLSWLILLLLLIGLPAQVLWFQYEAWVQDPQIRPVYGVICGVAGCELPPLRDVSLIVSQKSFIRAHPDRADARIVDVLMINNAEFAQPYPLIELRATSVRGQIIAGRRFKPEEYLQGDIKPTDLMPSRAPVHVSLEIQDPGEQAMNFEVKFR